MTHVWLLLGNITICLEWTAPGLGNINNIYITIVGVEARVEGSWVWAILQYLYIRCIVYCILYNIYITKDGLETKVEGA